MIYTSEQKSIKIEKFLYDSPNGKIEGWAVIPDSDSPRPLIVFCRGGNRDYGAIDQSIMLGWIMPFALSGFAVIGSQYSGGPNSEGKDEYGGKDTQDIFALIKSIRKEWNVDLSKIGILGVSRGAMMGMQVLRDGLDIKRAAFVGGMFDAQKMKSERPDIYDMWTRDKMFDFLLENEIEKRSAITFGDKLPNIPYLILHSKEDSKVHVRQAEEMKKVLGNRAELMLFEGDDHGLRKAGHQRNKLLIDWFSEM